jgi:uncharacterized membrane protein
MGTNRLESFSDGVIAVAITLLILGITVPEPGSGESLGHALLSKWPEYAAYVTSFLTIGIIWINHHVMINRLARADHAILMLNILLLMSIVILPFATELMATYLRASQGQEIAAAVYAGALLFMAVSFATLNRHILMVKDHMLAEPLPLEQRRAILRRSVSGVIPYAAATPLAFVSPYIPLLISAALAGYYALPVASGVAVQQG